ncbi:hypothetical protein FHR83_009181 [Actinoplanes campanulatus]|uniref:Polyketide cyclase / dehydrase and lipid transport n=1 Tax=Actinoplanes campanulatus TaxID=113559 RepID=A0A7W5ASK9_9ACTN|nr:hypothetical protein [Actinoplanes campanulatus]MBB3101452.1 hypothetical protein [Actinoplanes campanulatus]GGN50320.1 hypothetical protein GCM10010109_89360 [Actinoplanes campanulatus]GID42486.1 hypothetical protein Aca09nite_89920 [Actinoplanes campanulatus]
MQNTPSLIAELDALPARWEVRGALPAPAAAVAGLLLAVREGRVGDDNLLVLARAAAARRGAMTVVGGSGSYRAEFAGPVEPVEIQVDRERARLAVRSWYAGVHTVTACPEGARVTHRVHQVVPDHPGFTAGIAEFGLHTRMSRDLRQILGVIADRLGC